MILILAGSYFLPLHASHTNSLRFNRVSMMLLIMKVVVLIQASTIAAVPWNGSRQDVLENAAAVIPILASLPITDGKIPSLGVTRPSVS